MIDTNIAIAGRPIGKRTRSISIKVSPSNYEFLERIGRGIAGRGLRILAEMAEECDSKCREKSSEPSILKFPLEPTGQQFSGG